VEILFLSDWETQGGAAVAAGRLAATLCRRGQRVLWAVNVAGADANPWRTVTIVRSRPERIVDRLCAEPGEQAVSRWLCQRRLLRLLASMRPDVIHLHNLHGARSAGWSSDLLRLCAARAPTLWTLHDMWSFTGRCAYACECRRFTTGCDATCPTPSEYPALEPRRIAGAWARRRRTLARCPAVAAVAPSRWLAAEARAGLWAGHRVEVIPYGVPLDTYRPLDRHLAREALGLDARRPILLVAAADLSERRKGFSLLLEALGRLRRDGLTLMTLGRMPRLEAPEGLRVEPLSHVEDDRTKVLAYSAADLLVHPALADNFPNVVLEALACGTPTLAFARGGLPEMVRPGRTGWVASEVSAEALATTLGNALDELAGGMDLRKSCRTLVESEYGADLQADRYLALYDELRRAFVAGRGSGSQVTASPGR
jgi:glycosyltransferase involved in cell wall biosynthesis